MTGLLAALAVAAVGVAALLLIRLGFRPPGTVAVSPARWLRSGELALPGQVR